MKVVCHNQRGLAEGNAKKKKNETVNTI